MFSAILNCLGKGLEKLFIGTVKFFSTAFSCIESKAVRTLAGIPLVFSLCFGFVGLTLISWSFFVGIVVYLMAFFMFLAILCGWAKSTGVTVTVNSQTV